MKQIKKRMKKAYLLLIILVIILLTFSGCGTLETLLKNDDASTTIGGWIGDETGNAPANSITPAADGRTIALYFADSTGKYLVKEERTLPKTLSLARETINQWLKGPAIKNVSVQSAVSPTTTLLDIGIKDGVLIVDLSKDFLQPYGQITPEVAVYGLVNTLTQFSTVKEVQIRIEGKQLNTYRGINTSHLKANQGLIKALTSSSNSISFDASGLNSEIGGNKSNLSSPSAINLFSDPSASSI